MAWIAIATLWGGVKIGIPTSAPTGPKSCTAMVPPTMSSMARDPSATFSLNSWRVFSTCSSDCFSTSRSTTTASPSGPGTFTLMSTYSRFSTSLLLSRMKLLIAGTSWAAAAIAFATNEVIVKRTPWVFSNNSLYSFCSARALLMSTSLKEVSSAMVFWVSFSRVAMRLRIGVSGTRCSSLLPGTTDRGGGRLSATGAADGAEAAGAAGASPETARRRCSWAARRPAAKGEVAVAGASCVAACCGAAASACPAGFAAAADDDTSPTSNLMRGWLSTTFASNS
mmetsp:Transcript_45889/g.99719  ORF Transcript_45889/g.99719 Transcript_45889/m.99719 type:complete len:282 (+) Transcript_45889:323-1168(+)